MPVGVSTVQVAQAADTASGGTYYVAPNGSDSAAGSQSAPFKTIAKAAEVAKAGDNVLVKGGTYNGQVTFSKSGTPSALITFRAASGERPKIVASGSKYAFDFSGQSYISVEGFDVSGSQSHLFRLESGSSTGNIIANNILHNTTSRGDGVRIMAAKNTQVLNNKMHHVQYGVKVERSNAGSNGATNTLIKGNEIYKPGVDCIYLAAPGVTVDGNNLHDNNATYSAGEHADGVQVYMKSYTANSKIVFSNNLIDLKDQPGSQRQCNSLMLENAGGITIFNNVINGRNEANGINLKSCPDSKVFNNTVVDVANSTIYVHKGSTVASSNVLVYNNIAPGIKVLSDGSRSGSQTGNNSVGTDPQFVNKAAGDFRIKAGSPAVDKGYANSDKKLPYPDACIDGGQRIVNGKIDIGAYEFGAKPVKPVDSINPVNNDSETAVEETDESQAGQVVSNDETALEGTGSDTATDTSVVSTETCGDSSCTETCENGFCTKEGAGDSRACDKRKNTKKHHKYHNKQRHGKDSYRSKNKHGKHVDMNNGVSDCVEAGSDDCTDTVTNAAADTDTIASDENTIDDTENNISDVGNSTETGTVNNTNTSMDASADTAVDVDDGGSNGEKPTIDSLVDFLKRFLAENQSIKQLIIRIRN
jgi:hypothetical protein